MKHEPLPPHELAALLNGVSEEWRDQLAATAIGLAQARYTHMEAGWRQRVFWAYRRAREAARGDRRAA